MTASFPVLTTSRLLLRQVEASDSEALFHIHSDAEWMRWYGIEPVTELAQAQQLAEMFASWFVAGTGFRWVLERHEDGRTIGTCGLFRWNKSWHNCLTGYEIARDCQQQGYMREALTAILDFGFRVMLLHRIQAETHPANIASISLAKAVGFQLEGIHREQAFWSGKFHDLHCYSLLEQDWRMQNTQSKTT